MTILPRPVADFRRLSVPFDLGIPDEKRWEDRGIMECNLVTAWRRILEHYRKVADVPFSLDATTLERQDRPLDYTAFREALINLSDTPGLRRSNAQGVNPGVSRPHDFLESGFCFCHTRGDVHPRRSAGPQSTYRAMPSAASVLANKPAPVWAPSTPTGGNSNVFHP